MGIKEAFERPDKFTEEDIPQEILEYFDSFSEEGVWNQREFEYIAARDKTFPEQVWSGIVAVMERLIDYERDEQLGSRWATVLNNTRRMKGTFGDIMRATIDFRAVFLSLGVAPEALSIRNILRAAYATDARTIQDGLQQDPQVMRPFRYGWPDAPHISPLHDERLPGWANAELDKMHHPEATSENEDKERP